MKSIQIKNSYNIWSINAMKVLMTHELIRKYNTPSADKLFRRSYVSMYIEWWLHNIGYYITKPFCSIEWINKINLRFKHVDINEWNR